ncbi:MAG: DUF1684 domain-containing protein [Crocinitomicaceae bacterium]|nr:DUF1684 domain-containing protein [Crocinitomicaceae bacterium]
MKKTLLPLICILSICICNAQMTEAEVSVHRAKFKEHLLDTASGMLNASEIEELNYLSYFPFDSNYQVAVTFKKSKGKKFEMPTSTERKPVYRRYGYITFIINGDTCILSAYKSLGLKEKEYKNYLFVPFRDATSRNETYGGGRFLDFSKPKKGGNIFLDFNLAYNPYCAYSHRYSCPIPPEENTLSIPILAGERTPVAH